MSRARSAKKPTPANETGSSARAIWNGSIAFGLVEISVGLHARERNNDIAFHQIDRRDGALVGYERVNNATHKAVAWNDIAKGYEIRKGQFVIVGDDDFEKANVRASRTIEVQDFVRMGEIPPAYFERPYFLVPDKRGQKAYLVLRDALQKKKLAAVALIVLRTRQHLCAIVADGDWLSLELLRFAHELRPARDLRVASALSAAKATSKEVTLADQFIDNMVVRWEPEKYKDSYRDQLLSAIRDKAETGTLEPREVPAERSRAPLDLASLLQKSIAGAKKKHGKRKAA